MFDAPARSLWRRAVRRTAAPLAGLDVPRGAGAAHLVTTLRETGSPQPSRFMRDDRVRGRDGTGVGLCFLAIAVVVVLVVLTRVVELVLP